MKYFLHIILLFITLPGFSQNSPIKVKNQRIQSELNRVVQAYFKDFAQELGDTLSGLGNSRVYKSKISLPGAQSAVIKKYFSPLSYSWEAVMPDTEDFAEAARMYNQYYKQINNAGVSPNGFDKRHLIGNYNSPDESRSFAASTFRIQDPKVDWKNFMIQLDLQYEFPYWRTKISMFEKIPDDEIRPTRQKVNIREAQIKGN